MNYPLKFALVNMEEDNIIDMDCSVTKYCVSHITRNISQAGIHRHVESWNHHRIPSKSIKIIHKRSLTSLIIM